MSFFSVLRWCHLRQQKTPQKTGILCQAMMGPGASCWCLSLIYIGQTNHLSDIPQPSPLNQQLAVYWSIPRWEILTNFQNLIRVPSSTARCGLYFGGLFLGLHGKRCWKTFYRENEHSNLEPSSVGGVASFSLKLTASLPLKMGRGSKDQFHLPTGFALFSGAN